MTGSNFARRSRRLAVAVGAILTGYAGVAGAAQWRFDNGSTAHLEHVDFGRRQLACPESVQGTLLPG